MKAPVFCSLVLILIVQSYGGLITLQSSLSCEVTPPSVKAKLLLVNKGNEAAHNIQAVFNITGKLWHSKIFPTLEANQTLEIECPEEYELEKKGSYVLTAKINFQDAAGYPFTTVVVTPFIYKEATGSMVYGKLGALSLSDRGILKLNITNIGNDDFDLDVNVLIPDELSVEPGQKQLKLKARSKEKLLFELSNFSALGGAVYPAWAVIEYDHKDMHFANASSCSITIKHEINIFKKHWWIFLILVAVIIILVFWFNLRKKIR